MIAAGAVAGIVGPILFTVTFFVQGLFRLEEYDPVTNTWSTRAPMSIPRYVLAAAAANGIVYAVGGNNGGAIMDTLEAYDPITNSWSTRAPMPTRRSRPEEHSSSQPLRTAR